MARFIAYHAGGRDTILNMSKESFNAIEQAVRWAEYETPEDLRNAMNSLCFHMAVVSQGFARKMSFGANDPKQQFPNLAWKIPVRRISGRYYTGWKVRKRGPAHWEMYNDSREAYFIEFGINPRGQGRRVRRPIRKMTLRRTIEFMMATQAFHRVWTDAFANPKRRHRGQGFTINAQSPPMGSFSGPGLGRSLP